MSILNIVEMAPHEVDHPCDAQVEMILEPGSCTDRPSLQIRLRIIFVPTAGRAGTVSILGVASLSESGPDGGRTLLPLQESDWQTLKEGRCPDQALTADGLVPWETRTWRARGRVQNGRRKIGPIELVHTIAAKPIAGAWDADELLSRVSVWSHLAGIGPVLRWIEGPMRAVTRQLTHLDEQRAKRGTKRRELHRKIRAAFLERMRSADRAKGVTWVREQLAKESIVLFGVKKALHPRTITRITTGLKW